MTEARAAAEAAMSPKEREAVVFADSYYGAEAKIQASKLLEGLGVGVAESVVVLEGLAAHLDDADFTIKHEVADHFRRLGEILGNVAMTPTAYLIPVPDSAVETTEPETIEPTLSPEAEVELAHPQPAEPVAENSSGIDTSELVLPDETPHSLNPVQRRLLTNIFGVHNQAVVTRFSRDQLEFLVDSIGEHYQNFTINRLSLDAKIARRAQMKAIALDGVSAKEIAEPYGVTPGGISQAMKQMIKSIHLRTDQVTLDAMVANAIEHTLVDQPEPTKEMEDVKQEPLAVQHRVRSEAIETFEPKSLNSATKDLGAFLCLERQDRILLDNLFGQETRRKDESAEARLIRETVRSIYEIVKSSKNHNFTNLEMQAFDLFTGPNIMTVRELRSRMSNQLRDSGYKTEGLLSSAIVKILDERQRTVRSQHGVLAN